MDKMYTYNIQYGAHDTSDCSHLQHKKKFSREEMREMFKEAIIYILKKQKEDKRTYFDFECLCYYDNIHSEIIDYFCKHFGFQKYEFDVSIDIYGSRCLIKEEWNGYGEDDKILAPIIPDIVKEVLGDKQ